MIKVWIETTDGHSFSAKVIAIPRITETVMVKHTPYRVIDVVHRVEDAADRYTEASIKIFLDMQ